MTTMKSGNSKKIYVALLVDEAYKLPAVIKLNADNSSPVARIIGVMLNGSCGKARQGGPRR